MSIQSIDQLGNIITLQALPRRIVSLVPSQTEFLFDIGLDEEVVGITRYCTHPAGKVQGKAIIGGTKKFDIEKIKALQPDLIIGNKEENYEEGILELQKLYPVWMSDIYTLPGSLNMMREVGRITGRQQAGEELATEIDNAFTQFKNSASGKHTGLSCAYFIWRKPYMVAAANTFIDEMIKVFGLKNVFNEQQRYPEITSETLTALNPDFIFLSSEPYSFSERHFDEFQLLAPNAKVVLVDGEMFSWYGSRLRYAPGYFEWLRGAIGL